MIFDMHCDTLYKIREERKKGTEMELRSSSSLCVNLEKMKAAGYGLQNFAVYIDMEEQESPYENAMELVRIFEEEMKKNKDRIVPVTDAPQIEEALRTNRLAAMLTLEEGGMCEGDIEKLREFHRHGARMLTLTWNYENELGYSAALQSQGNPNQSYGLKERGFEFLEEMEALHMIPDVSHLSDDGFWDVSQKCRKPFVASHSNARALCGHFRNLTDEMIRCMGENGCVAGLNFYPEFLTESKDAETWLNSIGQHAVHMIQKGGRECLGLGTDFDGFHGGSVPNDALEMEKLVWILHRSGLSDDEIDGVLYKNVLRLYREALA